MSNNENQIPEPPETTGLDELEELARGPEDENRDSGEVNLRVIPGLAELESREEKKSSLGLFTLILLVLLIFAILMYHLNTEREKELLTANLDVSAPAAVTQPADNEDAVSRAVGPTTAPQKVVPKKVTLSEEDLTGSAKLAIRDQGALISVEKDPEIAAVGEAFRKRVEMIHGFKRTTAPKDGTVTETARGVVQGFRINSTRVKKQKNIIKDEIVISTPSRGVFVVKNNVLDGLRNTTYEKLYRDLEQSGIRVLKDTDSAKGIVKIRFRVTRSSGGSSTVNEFLITGQRLGKIEVDMTIAQMEAAIPKEYRFVRKRLSHEGEFYNVIKVFDEKQNSLFFVYEKDHKVWGIQVISNKFKTRNAIGIGSTLGDIRIYYARPKIWSANENVPLVSVSGIDGIFVLESEGTDFDRRVFPNSAKIVSIILGGSPFLEQTP
ncbi:MAG: hypothetical protein KAW12_31095 [Candidatus Aminicenantes bacterium]|nr:hypothetical protein [Candidatus Aminicenantes bacterium]